MVWEINASKLWKPEQFPSNPSNDTSVCGGIRLCDPDLVLEDPSAIDAVLMKPLREVPLYCKRMRGEELDPAKVEVGVVVVEQVSRTFVCIA